MLTIDLQSDPKVAAWCVIYESVPEVIEKSLPVLQECFDELGLTVLPKAEVTYDPETGNPDFWVRLDILYQEDGPELDVRKIMDVYHDKFQVWWFNNKYFSTDKVHFGLWFISDKEKEQGDKDAEE